MCDRQRRRGELRWLFKDVPPRVSGTERCRVRVQPGGETQPQGPRARCPERLRPDLQGHMAAGGETKSHADTPGSLCCWGPVRTASTSTLTGADSQPACPPTRPGPPLFRPQAKAAASGLLSSQVTGVLTHFLGSWRPEHPERPWEPSSACTDELPRAPAPSLSLPLAFVFTFWRFKHSQAPGVRAYASNQSERLSLS